VAACVLVADKAWLQLFSPGTDMRFSTSPNPDGLHLVQNSKEVSAWLQVRITGVDFDSSAPTAKVGDLSLTVEKLQDGWLKIYYRKPGDSSIKFTWDSGTPIILATKGAPVQSSNVVDWVIYGKDGPPDSRGSSRQRNIILAILIFCVGLTVLAALVEGLKKAKEIYDSLFKKEAETRSETFNPTHVVGQVIESLHVGGEDDNRVARALLRGVVLNRRVVKDVFNELGITKTRSQKKEWDKAAGAFKSNLDQFLNNVQLFRDCVK
jgi:hypothetical protein